MSAPAGMPAAPSQPPPVAVDPVVVDAVVSGALVSGAVDSGVVSAVVVAAVDDGASLVPTLVVELEHAVSSTASTAAARTERRTERDMGASSRFSEMVSRCLRAGP
ncbi:MAG: hypothetical protein RL238_1120 [Actinomycetota bacterium]